MDRVPTELLHEIFIKLTLKDKLECMHVCRSWYNTLDQRSLLDTLSISSDRFANLKAMIEGQPHRTNQVENLTLFSNESFDFDKRTLCNMFPNLREITLHKYSPRHERTNYLDTPFQCALTTSKLIKIVDFGECELTCQLAMSNMCSNLKSLELTFGSWYNHILLQLKNIPVLETLTLKDFSVELMELEAVHDNLPSVKNLCFDHIAVLSGEIPHDVGPARLITKLNISLVYAENLSTHIQLYKYLAKKYPSVIKPIWADFMITYSDINYTRKIYNKGIFPWYQKVGSQIDTFVIDNYCEELDAFRKLDGCGIKLRELELRFSTANSLFIEKLVQSQQSKYIQKLILIDTIPAPLGMMVNMEALTYLEINCTIYDNTDEDKPTIDFGQLIEACPATLLELLIKGVTLTSNKPTSNLTCIQKLTLKNINVTGATTITGTSLPNLSVLQLDSIVESHLAISLPNQHLKKVRIDLRYSEDGDNAVTVNTISDGKPQRSVIWPTGEYGCGGRLHCSDKATSRAPVAELMNLTCASIEELTYSIESIIDYDEDY